jgi:hypothetical protein
MNRSALPISASKPEQIPIGNETKMNSRLSNETKHEHCDMKLAQKRIQHDEPDTARPFSNESGPIEMTNIK